MIKMLENKLKNYIENCPIEIKEFIDLENKWLLNNIKNCSIIDIGCGYGRHISLLSYQNDYIVGIDNEENMLMSSSNYLRSNNNVLICKSNAEQICFRDNQFDYSICMLNTFGNFEKPFETLKEITRVTRNKIILGVWSTNSLQHRIQAYHNAGIKIRSVEGNKIFLSDHTSNTFSKDCLIHRIPNITKINDFGVGYILEVNKNA